MRRDRIIALHVQGLRTLGDLSLPLYGLTVLAGENSSGKSSILQACEILRRALSADPASGLDEIQGDLVGLLRHGSQRLRVGARVELRDAGRLPRAYDYAVTLIEQGQVALDASVTVSPVGSTEPIARHKKRPSALARVRAALKEIEVLVPSRLDRLEQDVARAFSSLRSGFGEAHWQETMDYVRLGLGDGVESIEARPSPEGGGIAPWMKLRNRDDRIPPSGLADGALPFLAFVAMFRLHPERTLLAVDEPELHLHPSLLLRVLGFFETIAEDCPVILATHSDPLLDGLRDPARSVVLCELGQQKNETRLRRPDAASLKEWLEVYRGLGDLRAAGYLDAVMKPAEP